MAGCVSRLRFGEKRGSILMEFVLVAPLVLILVSMILQFAHIWTARQITAYAAYCAARATMVVPKEEKKAAAKKAAELACAWMSLAGLPGSTGEQEVKIKGWGTIPGSDSADKRVSVEVREDGENNVPAAVVTVHFKFPLMLPLAGRMISWAVNHEEGLSGLDYGNHKLTEKIEIRDSDGNVIALSGDNPGWRGEETIMDENGNAVDRRDGVWGKGGRFPFITLTETCVLPMPYSTAKFPKSGFRSGASSGAVSDLTRRRNP